MTIDFTLQKYTELCQTVCQLDCPVMKVRDFFNAGQPRGFLVVLRHDVDRQMNAALQMAILESRFGISSSYYVRKQPSVFIPQAIQQLSALGHEVGYHYEVLAKTKGNVERAIQLFGDDLQSFRELVPVSTISMHGSPLSRWNNLDLWLKHSFEGYDVGDAVLSLDSQEIFYFTDTGRAWDAERFNIRDTMKSKTPSRKLHTTDDLIVFLQEKHPFPVFVNAHPNRWAAGWLSWCMGSVSDWVINCIKWVVARARSRPAHRD